MASEQRTSARHRPSLGLAAPLVAAAIALGASRDARGDDSVGACIAAHEHFLELRDQGKLIDARSQLAICAASACPDAVQRSCREAVPTLNAAIPTVVFDVKDGGGRDLVDVKLSVDGKPAGAVGVLAHPVDPGPHTFRFEAPGQAPVEKRLVAREGEKAHETVVLGGASEPAVAPPAPPREGRGDGQRVAGWVIGGLGVAGLITGGVLGLVAKQSYDQASGCAGSVCTQQTGLDATNSARNLGDVATIVLVASGVVVVGGAIVLLTAPRSEPAESAAAPATAGGVTLRAGLTPGGLFAQGTF